jgi:hypothetical protein
MRLQLRRVHRADQVLGVHPRHLVAQPEAGGGFAGCSPGADGASYCLAR